MGIFIAMLAVLFIGLKLGNVIDWHWGWVLAPIWGYVVFLLIAAIFIVSATTGQ